MWSANTRRYLVLLRVIPVGVKRTHRYLFLGRLPRGLPSLHHPALLLCTRHRATTCYLQMFVFIPHFRAEPLTTPPRLCLLEWVHITSLFQKGDIMGKLGCRQTKSWIRFVALDFRSKAGQLTPRHLSNFMVAVKQAH